MEWAAFERVNGSILIHERIDWVGAVTSYTVAAVNGSPMTLRKMYRSFFDWDREPPSEDVTSTILGMTLEAAASQPSPHSSSK